MKNSKRSVIVRVKLYRIIIDCFSLIFFINYCSKWFSVDYYQNSINRQASLKSYCYPWKNSVSYHSLRIWTHYFKSAISWFAKCNASGGTMGSAGIWLPFSCQGQVMYSPDRKIRPVQKKRNRDQKRGKSVHEDYRSAGPPFLPYKGFLRLMDYVPCATQPTTRDPWTRVTCAGDKNILGAQKP
jgi:hypothetical protein